MARSKGIYLKKQHGQNFLRDVHLLSRIPDYVSLDAHSSVFEIGCGDGRLTEQILQYPIARLWVFEIDPEWAYHVQEAVHDDRLMVFEQNILDVDFERFAQYQPWTLIANLPYHIVFPLLRKLVVHREYLKEGVIMVQEEVAQKIVATSGRGYGFLSLYLQRHFDWKLLDKVPPSAFYPPPKVVSRLMHFTPVYHPEPIENEDAFWRFIKVCFAQPRRTLGNNLKSTHYDLSVIGPEFLKKRAQQLSMADFLRLWPALP